jgi:tetratricopeptide (TPR) repeat protein
MIDDLRRSVRTSGEVSGGGDPDQRLKRHVLASKEAEAAGDLLRASHELQLALAIQPSNRALVNEYARLSGVVQRGLADNYEKQARYEEKQGKWAAAATSWMRVSDGRPEDAAAAQAAAENLLKGDGDLHLAQKYAQKALQADAEDVARLALLARVYLAAGLKLNAVRELEKAAKLDREDEVVKNLLREARA